MFRIIYEKELRDIFTSLKFLTTFLICSALIVLSFYVGIQNYKLWDTRYQAQVSENERQMSALTDWSRINHSIYMPPQLLASLVNGISNDVGQTISIRGVGELKAVDSQFQENPLFAVFRFLDLEFIFQVIMSLFAVLFAYNAINGEKETGTLRLTFANPVPKHIYILSKLLGYLTAIIIPLTLPVLLGYLLLFTSGISISSDEWIRLSVIIMVGFIFFSVFLTLSVFVSSLTEKSSSSFLILLVIWIFSVLIIPRTSVLLAGSMVDVPSVDEIAAKKAKNNSQLWKEDMSKLNGFKPSGEDPQQALKAFQQYMQKIGAERNQKQLEYASKLNEGRSNKQKEQENLAFGISRISPASAFSLSVMSLAGTSLKLQNQYLESASAYQESFRNFIQEKTGSANALGGAFMIRVGGPNEQDKKKIDPKELPKFEFMKPELSSLFDDSIWDIGLLVLFNLIFFLGSYISFLRYDVR